VGGFVKGDVVVVPFPFSQATGDKRRPAIVLASWDCVGTTDYLLCLVSSQNVREPYILALDSSDIENGSLNRTSYVRPTYLFTVGESRILRKIGTLKPDKLTTVLETIKSIL